MPRTQVGHTPSAQLLPPPPYQQAAAPATSSARLTQPGPEPSHLLTCPSETSLHGLLLSPAVQLKVTSILFPAF